MRTCHSKYRKKKYPDAMNQVEKFYLGFLGFFFKCLAFPANCPQGKLYQRFQHESDQMHFMIPDFGLMAP